MIESRTVLVCGGRDYADRDKVFSILDGIHKLAPDGITLIVHGRATGADTLAGDWADQRGIPVSVFPADWKTHGKAAGPIRNQQMLEETSPDMVVAFAGGRGTADMIRRAKKWAETHETYVIEVEGS